MIRDSAQEKETFGPSGSTVARPRHNRVGAAGAWQILVATSSPTKDLRFLGFVLCLAREDDRAAEERRLLALPAAAARAAAVCLRALSSAVEARWYDCSWICSARSNRISSWVTEASAMTWASAFAGSSYWTRSVSSRARNRGSSRSTKAWSRARHSSESLGQTGTSRSSSASGMFLRSRITSMSFCFGLGWHADTIDPGREGLSEK